MDIPVALAHGSDRARLNLAVCPSGKFHSVRNAFADSLKLLQPVDGVRSAVALGYGFAGVAKIKFRFYQDAGLDGFFALSRH
jgi:hypothetical protein